MNVILFLEENWMYVVALAAVLILAVKAVWDFIKLPTEEQTRKVKEWMIWACIEAEKTLQSGTGQLKLRQVYDMFCAVPAFTWIAKIISFEQFSVWVSDALIEVKQMLVSNQTLAAYVYGENAEKETKKIKEQMGI